MKNNKNIIEVNKKDVDKALNLVNKMEWAFADGNDDDITDYEDNIEDILKNMEN